MKILIKGTAVKETIAPKPAHAGHTREEMSYHSKLRELQGKWVTVEMEYLFQDQFNIVENNLRIYIESVEDIDFEDITFEEYQKRVIERYKTDWPGTFKDDASELVKETWFYAMKRVLFAKGKFPYDPAIKIEEIRGYNMFGQALEKDRCEICTEMNSSGKNASCKSAGRVIPDITTHPEWCPKKETDEI